MPRNITITFDDGTNHEYQNVPDEVTPDQISERANKDFSGKKLKSIGGGNKPAETKPTGEETPRIGRGDPRKVMAEGRSKMNELFGWDKSRMHMPTLGDIGASAGKGALAGGALGGGFGLVTGGPGGGLVGALGGAGLGAAGGAAEELLGAAGFGPGTQMAGSMLMPGQGAIIKGAEKIAPKMTELGAAGMHLIPGASRAKMAMQSLGKTDNLSAQAKAALTGGAPESRAAEKTAAQAIQEQAASKVEQQRLLAQQQEVQIRNKFKAEQQQRKDYVAKMRGEVDKAKAAEQKAASATAAQIHGLNPTAPSDLGNMSQKILQERMTSLNEARAAEYKQKIGEYFDFARAEQRAGRPFQSSEQGKGLIKDLQGMLKPTEEMGKVQRWTPDQEKAIRDVLNEIQGVREVKVEVPYPHVVKQASGTDVEHLDTLVRQLGEAERGRPAEGYKAIGEGLAKDLKVKLTDALKEWAPAGSEAKKAYIEASRLLDPFKDSQISKVTRMSDKVKGQLTTDPQNVPKTLFKSKESVNDLLEAMGGDAATVKALAKQHVNNELAALGGDSRKVDRWLENPKNKEWTDAAGIKGHGQDFAKTLKELSAKAEGAAKGAEVASGKVASATAPKAEQQAAKVMAEKVANVNKQATDYATRINDIVGSGKSAETALEGILNKASGSPDAKATFTKVGQLLDAKSRAAMPDAVRQYMSRSKISNLSDNWQKLRPMLEHGKFIEPAALQKLDADVSKALKIMGASPTVKQRNSLAAMIAARVGGNVAAIDGDNQ